MQTAPDAPADDLKLVKLTGERISAVDDPADPIYPYRLEVNLSPPELMQVAFVMLHGGSEEIVVRGKSREAIERFVADNDLRRHPRLRWFTVTGPRGLSERFSRW